MSVLAPQRCPAIIVGSVRCEHCRPRRGCIPVRAPHTPDNAYSRQFENTIMNTRNPIIIILASLLPLFSCTDDGAGLSTAPAQGVIERFVGEMPGNVSLVLDPSLEKDGCDAYRYSVRRGRLTVEGSSQVALCKGFHDYARRHGIVSGHGAAPAATGRKHCPRQEAARSCLLSGITFSTMCAPSATACRTGRGMSGPTR